MWDIGTQEAPLEKEVIFEETVWYKRVNLEYKNDMENKFSTALIRDKGASFINLLEECKKIGKDWRLIALAETSIEEAVMWAIKAINK